MDVIATHLNSGKAYEGHQEYYFFVSREIGSDEPCVPRDSGGFFEYRRWTQEDHDFNMPKESIRGTKGLLAHVEESSATYPMTPDQSYKTEAKSGSNTAPKNGIAGRIGGGK